jgi:hypothetical protein
MWMPMTLHYIEHPSPVLWAAIVFGLWTTGLASVALAAAIAMLQPREPQRFRRAALAGSIGFLVQTFVLDSCVAGDVRRLTMPNAGGSPRDSPSP